MNEKVHHPKDMLYMICYVLALYYTFFMERIIKVLLKRVKDIAFKVLRCGPIPEHVAFIMDGNRRYAKRYGREPIAGHYAGFLKFEQVLEWCLHLGIRTVTVYAFSVENFKRPLGEVEGLMKLAMEKLTSLAKDSELIEKHQVRIKVVGELDLLPEEVKGAAYKVMYETRHHTKRLVNICFPYTNREEILHATGIVNGAVNKGILKVEDVTRDHMAQAMYIASDVQIVVRTSGERRLSDFMTWQCVNSSNPPYMAFINVLWPDLSLWQIAYILLKYQFSPEWIKYVQELEDGRWHEIASQLGSAELGNSCLPLTPPQSPYQPNNHDDNVTFKDTIVQ